MATSSTRSESPLVVIVGPTASGKTALAIRLAEQFGGEIICADSRTIYKEMDIGTAKPSAEERQRVPHWGLDLVSPGERFSAADFKLYALEKIAEIRARQRVPFLVGGTGLYIDGVIFDYQFGPLPDEALRRQLEGLSLEELHDYCIKNNIELPTNPQNKRYVIRAIENHGMVPKRSMSIIPHTIVVGIATDKTTLEQRIDTRAEQLFENGVVEEAKILGKKYGWESEAMTGNIYPIVRRYIEEEISYDEAVELFQIRDRQLAKRQLTWFRRNSSIRWLPLPEAERYIANILADSRPS